MPATKTVSDRNAPDGKGFTAEEKAAMRERAREEKAQRSGKANGQQDLLAKIADMPPSDKAMAERLHELITTAAPDLEPRTWYGMPAWAKDGKVLCFFTPAAKFKERYASFGFNATANLDEGAMWPTAWALTALTPADEARVTELVKKAVS
jgi:uncharacterized protein YdhG (YjbR/CyaY superfamily)